eukprot:TRINITY_DN1237_c0_g1_i3.p1 TRINITY_DN1237_c0_g1~~TRINITY_DN1237_c0_g1_i3.p1  ORF type:complete len:791 (-),score=198.92 TRINITY_DN1237_c0_g1_i3:271-2643(-)
MMRKTATQPTGMAGVVAGVCLPWQWAADKFDHWASRILLNSPAGIDVLHRRWLDQIEAQNLLGRRLWLLCVSCMILTVSGLWDNILLAFLCVVIPICYVLHTGQRFEDFGWLTQWSMHAWFALRLSYSNRFNQSPREELINPNQTRVFYGMFILLVWNEISLRRPSSVVFHHTMTQLIIAVCYGQTKLCPSLSIMFVMVFIYRRFLGPGVTDQMINTITNNRLEQTQKEAVILRGLSESKSEFMRTLCHELRNPLTAVQGNNEMLVKKLTDYNLNSEQSTSMTDLLQSSADLQANVPKLLKMSSNALLSAQHMARILNQTLDLAKMESETGIAIAATDNFCVSEALEVVVSMFEIKAMDQGIDFRLHVDPPDLWVVTNKNWLTQIVINLVGNALKFTEEGSVEIVASYSNDVLTVTVRDTGIGMTSDEQEKLFAPFSQAHEDIRQHYGGSGLGLDIVRNALEHLNGSIMVTSTKNKGSTFTFTLPVGLAEKPADATEEEATNTNHWCKNQPLVLVAEDDVQVRQTLCEQLEAFGCRVIATTDGQGVVAETKKQKFHLIFTDINMPVLGGLEATQVIRSGQASALNVNTPIVGISANASKADTQLADQAGMDGFIAKPYQLSTLAETLKAYTEPRQRESPVGSRQVVVLIVDDDNSIREMMAEFVSVIAPKVKLVEAVNGQQAVDLAANQEFALIFMDLWMPVMDGIQATQEIRKSSGLNCETPIVCLSGNTHTNKTADALRAGMSDFVSKPYTLKDIEGKLATHGVIKRTRRRRRPNEREDYRVQFRRGD